MKYFFLLLKTSLNLCILGLSFVYPAQARLQPSVSVPQSGAQTPIQTQPLSLDDALHLAAQNYALQQKRLAMQSRQETANQSRHWPNPALQFGAEDYPSLRGQTGEFNLMWQQPINPAQPAQVALADQNVRVSETEITQRHWALRQEVTQTFYQCLMWEAYLKTVQELQTVSTTSRQLMEAQYAQGKRLLTDVNRARLAEENLFLQSQKAQMAYQNAKQQFKRLLNHPGPLALKGVLIRDLKTFSERPMPETQLTELQLAEHPEALTAQARLQQRQKQKALQRAQIWQPSTWSLGMRLTPFENNVGALTQFNIPFPAWQQNQGGIAASEYAIQQAQVQQSETAFALQNRWQQAYHNYTLTRQNLLRYQNQLLPLARQNLALSQKIHRQGKQSVLEVLDAQRSALEINQDYLLQWGQFHNLRAELTYLQGSAP